MKIRNLTDREFQFYCEGCNESHTFNDSWDFNKDYEKPTVNPSLLVRGTQPITDEEFDLIKAGKHVEPRRFVCHSFIRDGTIQYLSDCTHKLAGQTLELKDID